MGEGVRIPCTFPLDPALEFRNSERGTLGKWGVLINRAKERGKGKGGKRLSQLLRIRGSCAPRTRACVPPRGDRFAIILFSLESI